MVTKREYLQQRDLITGGRGRWPKAAHDAIADAINRGVKFDEPEKPTSRVVTNGNGEKTTVTVVRATDVVQAADPRPDRHPGMFVFKNPDGREFKRLHTTACVKCSYSFLWCFCPEGPFQFVYLSGSDEYAELISVPQVPRAEAIADAPAATRRGRGRPRKQVA